MLRRESQVIFLPLQCHAGFLRTLERSISGMMAERRSLLLIANCGMAIQLAPRSGPDISAPSAPSQ
jgi:hypothetical protein